jgi:hypothetical protein
MSTLLQERVSRAVLPSVWHPLACSITMRRQGGAYSSLRSCAIPRGNSWSASITGVCAPSSDLLPPRRPRLRSPGPRRFSSRWPLLRRVTDMILAGNGIARIDDDLIGPIYTAFDLPRLSQAQPLTNFRDGTLWVALVRFAHTVRAVSRWALFRIFDDKAAGSRLIAQTHVVASCQPGPAGHDACIEACAQGFTTFVIGPKNGSSNCSVDHSRA